MQIITKIIKVFILFLWWVIYTAIMPILLVVSFAMRFKFGMPKAETDNFEYLNPITINDIANLDTSLEGEGQDKCKWYGFKTYATGKQEDWEYLYNNFVDKEKCVLIRSHDNEATAFSGDMYEGFLIGYAEAKNKGYITEAQKEVLAKCFYNLACGSYISFRYPNDNYDRGYMSKPPICNGIALVPLSVLREGAAINKGVDKFILLFFYALFYISSLPLLLFGCYDRFFYWWNFTCIFDYANHSDLLLYKALDMLGMKYFPKKGLDYLYKVHAHWNLDIRVIAGEYDRLEILFHLSRLLDSRNKTFTGDTTYKVFSLEDLGFKTFVDPTPCSKKCNSATWERYGDRGYPNSNKSNADIINIWNILNK